MVGQSKNMKHVKNYEDKLRNFEKVQKILRTNF